ncbi:MAG: cytochrome P450 [Thermomicrobiales bacterium]
MRTDKEIITVNATALAAPSTTWQPGPSSRAFLRSALLPGTNPITRFTALQSRYGNTFAFHLRGRHFTMFIGPDANQYLLATNAAAFAQGASVRLGPVLGKGLLTSDGPLHATQRRLIQPAFHRGRIERYQATMAAELRGYRLPKGTIVGFSQYLSHRMPEHFAAPERFLPERFDPDGGEQHPPYAYIPFGAGPRSCIGSGFALMELKTIVPIILQRFMPDLASNQRIEIEPLVTLRAKRNIMMKV